MGKVIGIAGVEKPGEDMTVFASAKVSFRNGIADDCRGIKDKERQVSIISLGSWNEVCAELGTKLHWTKRRANILVEGIDLKNSTGKILRIGNFKLEITGELKPGNKMDEIFIGLKNALIPDWRGGVSAKVISEGVINEKDTVSFL